jgi:hypothetical protein
VPHQLVAPVRRRSKAGGRRWSVAILQLGPCAISKDICSLVCLSKTVRNPLDLLDTLDPVHSAAFAQMSSSLYT